MIGIELEFFVKEIKSGKIVPAFRATDNTDGNPIIGELKTSVYKDIVSCVFEMKKLIYLEKKALAKKGCEMVLESQIVVDDNFIKGLRSSREYINKKDLEFLKLLSIYGKSTNHSK